MIAESLKNTIWCLLQGGVVSLSIWLITMVFSIPIAIIIAVIKITKPKSWGLILNMYSSLIRGTPLLFQLFFVYFGLALIFKINLTSFTAASIVFVNSWAIYLSEIFRGGIESIDKNQYEAAKVLGLNYYQIMRYIILPQAIITILPGINNQAIEAIWATALLSTIGVNDILKSAKTILVRDFSITPFLITAIIYLLFNNVVMLIFKTIEKKYSKYRINYKTNLYENN